MQLRLLTKDLYRTHWSVTGKKIPGAKSPDESVYLPGKNLLLIAKAAVFCSLKKIHHIGLGPLKTNPFPDASRFFFNLMERTCSKGLSYKIAIHTPFLSRSKTEVMKSGKHLPLHLTFSCLAPVAGARLLASAKPKLRYGGAGPRPYIHCGACNKCEERKLAFRQAGLPDRTQYAR